MNRFLMWLMIARWKFAAWYLLSPTVYIVGTVCGRW
jgi:hypothetical protein